MLEINQKKWAALFFLHTNRSTDGFWHLISARGTHWVSGQWAALPGCHSLGAWRVQPTIVRTQRKMGLVLLQWRDLWCTKMKQSNRFQRCQNTWKMRKFTNLHWMHALMNCAFPPCKRMGKPVIKGILISFFTK